MTDRITDRRSLDAALARLLALDPSLPVPREPLPLRQRPPTFEGLAEIVVAQLVSRAAAMAIIGRMRTAVPSMEPADWLSADNALDDVGLSRAKRATIDGLARAIDNGALNLEAVAALSAEDLVTALTAHRGVGPWTAQVFALFCIGHTDTFPAGDIAIRAAMADVLRLDERPSVKHAEALGERWRPLRGIAARLLYARYAELKGGTASPL